ncbi:hypothetical protein [Actinoplanes xinjiangensis]|uniref:hypothetical protein n=1 Tax=Actinoplanes xinjiangensis TaxID=512350 RepID=UPI00342042E5
MRRSRGDALLDRLGGPLGLYAAACVAWTVVWFPFRLLLDRGDPIAEIVAASGLRGAVFALGWMALGWAQRSHPRAAGRREDRPPPTASQRRVRAHRGAVVGLGIGVPFFGGLIILTLSTGRSWGYTVCFAVLLAGIVAAAVTAPARDPS